MTTTKVRPAAMALAFDGERGQGSSLPLARVRQGSEASLKATPNFICGTVLTMARKERNRGVEKDAGIPPEKVSRPVG
jgi:hypothetical protein